MTINAGIGNTVLRPSGVQINHTSMANYEGGKLELDTHADTGCASSHVRIIEYTGQIACSVSGFSTELPSINQIPIINGAAAYDHLDTGEVFIIALNQHLYLGDKIENTLVCPNQCHYNNVTIDDVPMHLSPTSTHSIYFAANDIQLPLKLEGCISYLDIQYPTNDELENCQWLQLTSEREWDPYSSNMRLYEEKVELYLQLILQTVRRQSPLTNNTH